MTTSTTGRWNIDRALMELEPECPGTTITRTMMDVSLMEQHHVKPTQEQTKAGYGWVWSLAIGQLLMPKAFFYGHTIRQAFLTARKAAKKSKGELKSSWGDEVRLGRIKSTKGKKIKKKDLKSKPVRR